MSEELALSEGMDEGVHSLADDEFIVSLRKQMLQFATLQLNDRSQAEDAVQEALAGALKNARSFGGKSALKTWVFAILKHKIADVLRYKQRQPQITSLFTDDGDQELDVLFEPNGHWQAGSEPIAWGNPERAFKQKQFWHVFELCLEKLPAGQARIFMMREFIELESEEICDAANISMSNLFVTLHRARLRLGKCLEQNWFQKGENHAELP